MTLLVSSSGRTGLSRLLEVAELARIRYWYFGDQHRQWLQRLVDHRTSDLLRMNKTHSRRLAIELPKEAFRWDEDSVCFGVRLQQVITDIRFAIWEDYDPALMNYVVAMEFGNDLRNEQLVVASEYTLNLPKPAFSIDGPISEYETSRFGDVLPAKVQKAVFHILPVEYVLSPKEEGGVENGVLAKERLLVDFQ